MSRFDVTLTAYRDGLGRRHWQATDSAGRTLKYVWFSLHNGGGYYTFSKRDSVPPIEVADPALFRTRSGARRVARRVLRREAKSSFRPELA